MCRARIAIEFYQTARVAGESDERISLLRIKRKDLMRVFNKRKGKPAGGGSADRFF